MWLSSILTSKRSSSRRARPIRKASCRLTVELLEDRALPSFLAPVSYPVGVNPDAMAVGDFTGIGIPDLVVANSASSTVSVLLGKGDGTFQLAQNYAVGSGPVSLAVGDFNNDGKLDIVTANYTPATFTPTYRPAFSTVSVLLGNGNGTFQPALNYDLPPQPGLNNVYPPQSGLPQTPQSLAVGDFDKDGRLDVAVTAATVQSVQAAYAYYTYYQGYVNVLIGNGAGGFSADSSYALNDTSYVVNTYFVNTLVGSSIHTSVAVGDFTGNGNLALAVAETDQGVVGVLLGNGNGTFGPESDYSTASSPQSVAVGDFNGDGKLDLVTEGSSVSVLLGNGNGTFRPAAQYTTPGTTNSVAVADFNRDGKLDLAASGSYGVSALLGRGDGTFATVWNNPASGSNSVLAVGDFNRDGWPDLAMANLGANSVSVLLNAADWSASLQASSYAVSGFPSPTTAGTPDNFTVTVKKADGSTATAYRGTVHFTSNDPQAALPVDYTFTAADAGVHTFSATLKTAGTQSITATDTWTPSITGTQGAITINPAALSRLTVAGFPSPITAGVAGSFTLTATDAYGNRTGYLGTVHFTSSDPLAVLPANYTFTPADAGAHTFSAILKQARWQSLTATDITSASLTASQSIWVNPGPAATLVVWVIGSNVIQAGVADYYGVAPVDTYGNQVFTYTGTVHFTSSDPLAILPADYTFTAGAGVVFNLTLRTQGTQTITVSDTVNRSITGSVTVTVKKAASASKLIITAPSSVTAGAQFSLTVKVEDANGNVVTGYTGTVHFSSTDTMATLPQNYTFTAADMGVHTFTGPVLRKTGNQRITITDALNGSLSASVIIDVKIED